MFAVNQIIRMMDTDKTTNTLPENFAPVFLDPTVDWAFKYIFSHEEVLRLSVYCPATARNATTCRWLSQIISSQLLWKKAALSVPEY